MSGESRFERPAEQGLTEAQKRLVRDNLGLVGVHIRRHVPGCARNQFGREYHDLFQEGCLGLIRAAQTYRSESGIPFAAYALRRIHSAVSRAIVEQPAGSGAPLGRSPRDPTHEAQVSPFEPFVPVVVSLPDYADRLLAMAAPESPPPDEIVEPGESVGDRLRAKYERAIQAAAQSPAARLRRHDRKSLIEALLRERLLVPDEEARLPLREIARRLKSSYGRVADCERQLVDATRAALRSDPEFVALRSIARRHPQGDRAPVDSDLDGRLAARSADEIVRRLRQGDPTQRQEVLRVVADTCGDAVERAIHDRVRKLDPDRRENLLSRTSEPRRHGSRSDPCRSGSRRGRSSKRRYGPRRCSVTGPIP